jgi:hypothetical protein
MHTHVRLHSEERAISVYGEKLFSSPTKARFESLRVDSVRPNHLFGHDFDHDY